MSKRIVAAILSLVLLTGFFCIPTAAQDDTLEIHPELEKVYSLLDNSTMKAFANALYEGMRLHQTTISMSDYHLRFNNADEISEALQLLCDYLYFYVPELFSVDFFSTYRMRYRTVSGKVEVTSVYNITYTCSQAQAELYLAQYKKELRKIVNYVSGKGLTDTQKIIAVHDYFVAHYEYDLDYLIYDAVTFFREKKGVCSAYTNAFFAVMQRLGIVSYVVTDNIHAHAWNIVKIGSNYYHVDCTNDDPSPDGYGMVPSRHELLLTTDSRIMEHHIDYFGEVEYPDPADPEGENMLLWTGDEPCWQVAGLDNVVCNSNTFENAPWHESDYPIAICNGVGYMLVDTGDDSSITTASYRKAEINRLNSGWMSASLVTTVSSPAWRAPSNNSIWDNFYSGFFAVGNRLYLNCSNQLWSYSVTDHTVQTIPRSHSDQMYGCLYAGKGVIQYCTKSRDGINDENGLEYEYSMPEIGDANGDEQVTASDLVGLRVYLLVGTVGNTHPDFFDVTGDYSIDITDLIHMKKYVAGDIDSF